jgi:hypothetical protein
MRPLPPRPAPPRPPHRPARSVNLRTLLVAIHTSLRVSRTSGAAAAAPHDVLVIAADSLPPHGGAAFAGTVTAMLRAGGSVALLQPPHAPAAGATFQAGAGPVVRAYHATDAAGVTMVRVMGRRGAGGGGGWQPIFLHRHAGARHPFEHGGGPPLAPGGGGRGGRAHLLLPAGVPPRWRRRAGAGSRVRRRVGGRCAGWGWGGCAHRSGRRVAGAVRQSARHQAG